MDKKIENELNLCYNYYLNSTNELRKRTYEVLQIKITDYLHCIEDMYFLNLISKNTKDKCEKVVNKYRKICFNY